jgi:hypothetical protein
MPERESALISFLCREEERKRKDNGPKRRGECSPEEGTAHEINRGARKRSEAWFIRENPRKDEPWAYSEENRYRMKKSHAPNSEKPPQSIENTNEDQ